MKNYFCLAVAGVLILVSLTIGACATDGHKEKDRDSRSIEYGCRSQGTWGGATTLAGPFDCP